MKRKARFALSVALALLVLIVGQGCDCMMRQEDREKKVTYPKAVVSITTGDSSILKQFETRVECVQGKKFVVFIGFYMGEIVMSSQQMWMSHGKNYPIQPEECE